MSFGLRSRGLPMGSVERRELCLETEAFKSTVPRECVEDFLSGLSRGMGKATRPPPGDPVPITARQCAALEAEGWRVTAALQTGEGTALFLRRGSEERTVTAGANESNLQDQFPSTEKTPGAGTVEVTNNQPPRLERVPPAEMKVTMTATVSKSKSPELPGVLILDADTAGGRRLLSRVGPGRYVAARVDFQGRIGRVRRLGLRAALSEAVSIERDWFAGHGMCNTEWPPLLRDAAQAIGGAR